jgi:hypothetical protein
MIMEYTHDEYSDMLLTIGTCNSRTGTAARKYALLYRGRRHPDANIFPHSTKTQEQNKHKTFPYD